MKILQTQLAFTLLFLLKLTEGTKIYYRKVGDDTQTTSGVLCEYNFIPESSSFMISSVDKDISTGKYCLSYDSSNADCFQLINIDENSDYKVLINPRDNKKISIKEINHGTGSFDISADISTKVKVPRTPLDPLKKITKKYEDIKKEKKGTTSSMKKNNIIQREKIAFEDEVTEEKEPSFLVKNWRYIIVGFLIFKLMSGKDEKKEKKE
ncbi:hypothetical protein FOG51_02572 [Hanseniaspora uvarum]|nr:hypothetical protein FOG51_02572 [Hanseniaspora uvarum]GMM41068.1 hypothetical protein DAHU10_019690 [Hanseniaspora uvarum]